MGIHKGRHQLISAIWTKEKQKAVSIDDGKKNEVPEEKKENLEIIQLSLYSCLQKFITIGSTDFDFKLFLKI